MPTSHSLFLSLVPRSAVIAAPLGHPPPPDVTACGTCRRHILLLQTSPRFGHPSSPPPDVGTSVLHRPFRLGRAPPPRSPRATIGPAATTPFVSAATALTSTPPRSGLLLHAPANARHHPTHPNISPPSPSHRPLRTSPFPATTATEARGYATSLNKLKLYLQ
jgi:hypothetical protein